MRFTKKRVALAAVIVVLVFLLCRPGGERIAPPGETATVDIYGPAPARDVTLYATVEVYEDQTGNRIVSYGEAPQLAARVAAGELDPVRERLPDEPQVVVPYDNVGRYGGLLRVDAFQWRGYMHHGLFRRNSEGTQVVPDIAKGYEYSNDYESVTIYLRPGMRWSDGVPFTVDDILFVWEDDTCNEELTPVPPFTPDRKPDYVRIDDYTLRIDFAIPEPGYMARMSHPFSMAQSHFYNPKHYLKKWHIKYNPEAQELARSEGFENWNQAYRFHEARWKVEERAGLPTLNAWMVTAFDSSHGIAVRNPYFHQVDTAGNQLPYIDKILALRTKADETQAKIMLMLGQEIDHLPGFSELTVDDYPFLKEFAHVGDYRIVAFQSTMRSAMTVSFNPRVPDPVLNVIFNDLRFREALSLAIDRNAINNAIYLGLGVPRQELPLPSVSFYKEEWGNHLIEYDPERANALLDAMGLEWDADHRLRLRPDGRQLDLLIESGHGFEIEAYIMEILAGQFAKIGVKLTMKTEKMTHERLNNDEFELMICDHGGQSCQLDYEGGEPYFLNQGFNWNRWLTRWLDAGEDPEDITVGVEPPDEWKQLAEWVFEAARLPSDDPEWTRLKRRIWDFRSRTMWHIGTVYKVPIYDLVGNHVKNFPKLPWYGWSTGAYVLTEPQQWYFDDE